MRDGASDNWLKGGHLTSAAKKNPLDDAVGSYLNNPAVDLLQQATTNNRQLEVRLTADDLPMKANRVSLDPSFVDEYGVPVARIARKKGSNEIAVDRVGIDQMNKVFAGSQKNGVVKTLSQSQAILKLIGDIRWARAAWAMILARQWSIGSVVCMTRKMYSSWTRASCLPGSV